MEEHVIDLSEIPILSDEELEIFLLRKEEECFLELCQLADELPYERFGSSPIRY